MHGLTAARACAVAALLSAAPPALAQDEGREDPRIAGRAERVLVCESAAGAGCNASCIAASGEALFVYDRVRRALITELAAGHALVEVQRIDPDEFRSVLVGRISQCTLEGLHDMTLQKPQPAPGGSTPPAATPPLKVTRPDAPAAPPPPSASESGAPPVAAQPGSGVIVESRKGGGVFGAASILLLSLACLLLAFSRRALLRES